MTNSIRKASLDEVLADYAKASKAFDGKVLQAFVDKYPEHAKALQRYAQVQLTSVPASPEEVENEPLSVDEMLPLQSKLLQRMQELRGSPTASDIQEAVNKLDSISGDKATLAATIAVFGTCQHGEDLLFLSVIEPPGVKDMPKWFYEEMGLHLDMPSAVVQAGIAIKHQAAGQQRFRAIDKPAESPPMTWVQAVEACITDEHTKKAILEKPKRT